MYKRASRFDLLSLLVLYLLSYTTSRFASYRYRGDTALAEYSLHTLDVLIQLMFSYVGLDGSGKSTAVDSHCGFAAEQGLGHGNGKTQTLLLGEERGVEILQKAEGTFTALPDQGQVGIDVIVGECLEHVLHSRILLEEVHSPEETAIVAEGQSKFGQGLEEGVPINLPQVVFAKICCHLAHLDRD